MLNLALLAKQASTRPSHHLETPTDNVAHVAVHQNACRPACGRGMPAVSDRAQALLQAPKWAGPQQQGNMLTQC